MESSNSICCRVRSFNNSIFYLLQNDYCILYSYFCHESWNDQNIKTNSCPINLCQTQTKKKQGGWWLGRYNFVANGLTVSGKAISSAGIHWCGIGILSVQSVYIRIQSSPNKWKPTKLHAASGFKFQQLSRSIWLGTQISRTDVEKRIEKKHWLVVWTPLKNISQLGWWHSQYMGK